MSSQELDHPDRQGLLLELKDALGIDDLPTTIWACVWFSDVSKLRELVHIVQNLPQHQRLPFSLPLPSVDLLEMQWVLQRVAAICGGAEEEVSYGFFDDDDDDDDDDAFNGTPIGYSPLL